MEIPSFPIISPLRPFIHTPLLQYRASVLELI
jgi:hypothetical protein